MTDVAAKNWPLPLLPSVNVERRNRIAVVSLNRPEKRNALNDELVLGLQTVFSSVPEDVRAIILTGAGANFSAGLDLNELRETTVVESFRTSKIGQQLNDTVQFCSVPVIAVLQGAVIGGGFELAAAAHVGRGVRRLRLDERISRSAVFAGFFIFRKSAAEPATSCAWSLPASLASNTHRARGDR